MGKKKLLLPIAFATLSAFLFYKKDLGLNLLLFEIAALFLLFATGQIPRKHKSLMMAFAALLLSSVFTLINYSVFGYVLHFILCLLFTGLLIYPYARSPVTPIALSLYNLATSQVFFLRLLTERNHKGKTVFTRVFRAGIFILPMCIIVLFFLMYQQSNPVFERIFSVPLERITHFLSKLFERFNFLLFFTFLLGLLISNFIFLRKGKEQLIKKDQNASESLQRSKTKTFSTAKNLSLKNEYRAALFLFASLNLLLFLLNIADVYSVWFHFEWKGQYLKQYVHEGTYLLILSILISIALVLYYFRGNLNHYPQATLLRRLSFIWLAQNALLLVSVGIRNYWYIHFFALAYKRIGVYIFLLLTLFGLYSVWKKVNEKKSLFYLCKVNATAWLVVLTMSSLINWDSLIARYNFSKSGRAFLHLAFLSTLPDKCLPHLDKPYETLLQIDHIQKQLFHFDEVFMTPETYHSILQKRKKRFIEKWERKDILEWNYAEWRAYRRLTNGSS